MAYSRQTILPAEAEPPLFAGVDVGGTNIKFGVVDAQGRTLARGKVPSQVDQGPAAAMARAYRALVEATRSAGVDGSAIVRIGLGTPGPLNLSQGRLLTPGNLPGWWDFPIRDELARVSGKPVTFANDATSAAFGEFWIGSGQKWRSMVLFTLGTGVGGGIVIDDEPLHGAHSHGAELGHMIIDSRADARRCSCGQLGHLEGYASATALVARAAQLLQAGRASSIASRLGDGEQPTSLLIDEEAERGDALANEIILEAARYLSIGVVTIMHAVDPEGVVLGGAMTFGGHASQIGRGFLSEIQKQVKTHAFPVLARETAIDFATLGNDAGYIGAAGLARQEHLK